MGAAGPDGLYTPHQFSVRTNSYRSRKMLWRSPNVDSSKDSRWLSPIVLAESILLTSSLLSAQLIHKRYFRQLLTSSHISERRLAKHPTIHGFVTSVGDGDNLRLYHTPGGLFLGLGIWRFPPKKTKDTIHIRIAGVDAPECAHFGHPAQPFANEALAWLKGFAENRYVNVKLWRRDRYNRIVGSVKIRTWTGSKDVGLEMVKAGFATVYTAAGAEYGGLEKKLIRSENTAKMLRRGIWAPSKYKFESPAEYKRRCQTKSLK